MGDNNWLGTVVADKYRLDALLAEGGFGAVYRATHLPSGCDVAVKVLHASRAHDPTSQARFSREAELLGRLLHPHTVMTYEAGETPAGLRFIAMELLRGETLHDRLDRGGALPWRQAVALARDVCDSVGEAHGLGMIHRDLKPANIHLEPWSGEGELVKVLDFGIAKHVHGHATVDEDLTHIGEVIGTPEYMAPEQLVGDTLDERSDIYALGVVLYEMIVGRRPFDDATDPTALVRSILHRDVIPPSCGVELGPVASEIDRVVLRCLARQPADRFQTMTELAEALDALARQGRRRRWITSPRTIAIAPDEVTARRMAPVPHATAARPAFLPATTISSAVPPCPARLARGSMMPLPALAIGFAPTRRLRASHQPMPHEAPADPVVRRTHRLWFAAAIMLASVALGLALL